MQIGKVSLLVLFLLGLMACTTKKAETDDDEAGNAWPEMDSFHAVMADAYHPMKDSGNLAPAKRRAADMAAEAEVWTNAPLPARVDTDEMKQKLAKLEVDTKAFLDSVNGNAPDETLSASLENLHSEFHEIMETWHKSAH